MESKPHTNPSVFHGVSIALSLLSFQLSLYTLPSHYP